MARMIYLINNMSEVLGSESLTAVGSNRGDADKLAATLPRSCPPHHVYEVQYYPSYAVYHYEKNGERRKAALAKLSKEDIEVLGVTSLAADLLQPTPPATKTMETAVLDAVAGIIAEQKTRMGFNKVWEDIERYPSAMKTEITGSWRSIIKNEMGKVGDYLA